MKQLRIILFCLLCPALLLAQSKTDLKKLKGLDTELESLLEDFKVAGFAVSIVKDGEIIYAKGFGYSDLENKVKADENTLFAIGSSTKSFTTGLLGMLEKEGKLKFSDSPIKHIPELRFAEDVLNSNVTIEDMVLHRTGLPRHDLSWYFFNTSDRNELVGRIRHHEMWTGFRENWYYNNFMYLAQGVITERITGKSWEENIEERFFKPLNMTRSNATIAEMKAASNASKGYGVNQDGEIEFMEYYNINGMSPAGSINSSVSDMANYVKMWLNKGKFEDVEILPPSYIVRAMTGKMVVSHGVPSPETPDVFGTEYGYGWFINNYRGHYLVQHGGNINGFTASVNLYPTDNVGIVILVNQNASPIQNVVKNIIADRLFDLPKTTDWKAKTLKSFNEQQKMIKSMAENREEGYKKDTKPTHLPSEFTGKYAQEGYGEFEVKVENDSMKAYFPTDTYYLKHIHYNIFDIADLKTGEGSGQFMLNFTIGLDGDIDGIRFKAEPTIDPLFFKRISTGFDASKIKLETYIGKYKLGPQSLEMMLEEGKLYTQITGQPKFELIPAGEHIFKLGGLSGYSVEFQADESGKFIKLKIVQPNGTFFADRVD